MAPSIDQIQKKTCKPADAPMDGPTIQINKNAPATNIAISRIPQYG